MEDVLKYWKKLSFTDIEEAKINLKKSKNLIVGNMNLQQNL